MSPTAVFDECMGSRPDPSRRAFETLGVPLHGMLIDDLDLSGQFAEQLAYRKRPVDHMAPDESGAFGIAPRKRLVRRPGEVALPHGAKGGETVFEGRWLRRGRHFIHCTNLSKQAEA